MMNVRELKEKLRGLDDNLLVVIEDNSLSADMDEPGERDAFDLETVRVIELYPGIDALLLGVDSISVQIMQIE